MSDLLTFEASEAQLEYLASPHAVRERAKRIFDLAVEGKTGFELKLEQLPLVADRVLKLTQKTYPDGIIPFHARWEHFKAGGVDRVAELDRKLSNLNARDRARAKIDLAIVSVLLDAGAGAQWSYEENGVRYSRSEGLAVASYQMFKAGLFSSDPRHPLRVDAEKLITLTTEDLSTGLQVSPTNPMTGLEGRAELIRKLGHACQSKHQHFGHSQVRPGNLVDYYFERSRDGELSATEILKGLLFGLSSMWPARVEINGVAFGDVWHHPLLGQSDDFEALVPFHKLSQWLAYSLIEPVEEAGLRVTGVHELTGLPEYRNGGLFLDLGVMMLRDPAQLKRSHVPGDTLMIEWRALTIVLLDLLGEQIRKALGKTEKELPLAKILQGGTWTAGREVARERRPDGSPPFKITSDGTVF